MAFNEFTVEDQWKVICFWYETNAKHKKYSKSLTWQEFKGKCYIKTKHGINKIKENKENQPEFFQKLFSNLKSKIDYARIHGLQNIQN